MYDLARKLVALNESLIGSTAPYREPKALGATEKVKKTGPILGGNPNKRQTPLNKKFVGCSKEVKTDKEVLDEMPRKMSSKERILTEQLGNIAIGAMWTLISKKRKDRKATPEAVYNAAHKIADKFHEQLGFKKPYDCVQPLISTFLHHPNGLAMNESFSSPPPFKSMLQSGFPDVKVGDIIDLRKPIDMHGKIYKIDTDDDHDETIVYFKDVKTNKKYKTNLGNVIKKHSNDI